MKIAAAVLTRNIIQHAREDLFYETIDSLRPFGVPLHVVDNGSDDGTAELVADGTDWTPYLSTDENTTSGFGTWTCCRILAGTDADLCIVSDDDMAWSAGFIVPLVDWWDHAPDDLVLTGGHLEPEYPWNAITEQTMFGSTLGLIRASTGAASWTFPKNRFARLQSVAKTLRIDRQGTWDVPMCEGLTRRMWKIGQLDLAEHRGQGRSSWGNRTEALYGWNVEPVRETL
jgi:hypothetical protein